MKIHHPSEMVIKLGKQFSDNVTEEIEKFNKEGNKQFSDYVDEEVKECVNWERLEEK